MQTLSILIYDGSWPGLMTCIFEIYERKLNQVSIVTQKNFRRDAFAHSISIYTDQEKAKRVWAGLSKRISKRALSNLYSCYLSELAGIENNICQYIRLAFDMEQSPEQAYSFPAVLRVSQVERMVHREKHRMEAFIRFKLTKDEIYYAAIEPDFNVIPLIIKHFKNRYADQKWLIYDIKRNYGIYYDLENVTEVELKANDPSSNDNVSAFHEDEAIYQTLWSDYFKHVNITERKNNKLHLMHVPKRYWKHLTEKLAR